MKSISIFKKPKVKYYAVASESSYYVKEGTTVPIKKEDLEEVLKTCKYRFYYSENMHWDYDTLKCIVIKETTNYEVISHDIKTEVA